MAYRVRKLIHSDRAEMGESTQPLKLFLFVLESERCGCQQRNVVNGKACKDEGDQTSTAGQYMRQHYSTKRKFYNRLFELSEASAVKPTVVKHVCLEVLKKKEKRAKHKT